MNKPVVFKCSKCEFEHARVEQNPDGSLKLIVNPPFLQLIVINKDDGKAILKCHKCGNEDPVDLEFFRRF